MNLAVIVFSSLATGLFGWFLVGWAVWYVSDHGTLLAPKSWQDHYPSLADNLATPTIAGGVIFLVLSGLSYSFQSNGVLWFVLLAGLVYGVLRLVRGLVRLQRKGIFHTHPESVESATVDPKW